MIIVNSCLARQCHPETCCCAKNEYAVKGYDIHNHKRYYGTLFYGTLEECEQFMKLYKEPTHD